MISVLQLILNCAAGFWIDFRVRKNDFLNFLTCETVGKVFKNYNLKVIETDGID